jgi:hypothetical protein
VYTAQFLTAEAKRVEIDQRPISCEFGNDEPDGAAEDREVLLAEAEEDEEPPTRLEWRDEEEMDCEEIACEVGSGGRAFEDNPMPVLKGEIENCDKPLRILIDSGSGVNLINANVAATLDPSLECKCPQVVRIKVANGVRASLDRTFRIPLKFGAVSADPIICYVMMASRSMC